jgi:hypothetical protein
MQLKQSSQDLIQELIDKGWQFMLHYGDDVGDECKQTGWEADFTRRLKEPLREGEGLWDNHKCGYSKNADIAVLQAYKNIMEGNRLKVISESEAMPGVEDEI